MNRLHAVVYGRVQGVGYRAVVQKRAATLGVCGYVRNMPDGTVEIVAEGTEQVLIDLIDIANEGSGWCSVEKIDVAYSAAEGNLEDFSIAY
ncbi:acylphosphatase [Denitrovibrio acetiphilus DSM 12809]|uniref:acylphosphatase n=1 Tax=Denitrovibrio acetiphilus (strain DSM 12809 / NBRC 114555 / N2460) TaxID=522772 RepID=D4H736_DENA2|nr:acylphosphatase [Denitrovibrio acetiphilus]ADD69740.1 acylphosphatase [Denitrovibrio acetiphilus DSM 12809]